ncbi:MAG: hypothetical protein M0038_12685 [Pseudomonadota bacterium]|jgi:hypothetical protein|nr:hypothetical protein [Pseudomonadota bacterium]
MRRVDALAMRGRRAAGGRAFKTRASAAQERVVNNTKGHPGSSPHRLCRRIPRGAAALGMILALHTAAASDANAHRPTLHALGPYNATFLAGGIGLKRPLPRTAALLRSGAAWSISA